MKSETITQNAELMRPKVRMKHKSKQKMWMVWHLYLVPVGVFSLLATFSLMMVLIPPLPKMLFLLVAVIVTSAILLWSGGMVFRAYSHQSNGFAVASGKPSIAKRLIAYYGIILLTVSVIFFSGCVLTSKFPDKDKLSERTKHMEQLFLHELTK